MRIGVDAHSIGAQKTGNETYTYYLLKYLAQIKDARAHYILYYTNPEKVDNPPFTSDNFEHRLIKPINAPMRLAVGFPMESHLRNFDIFFGQYFLPAGLRCKTVLTVHDLSFERYPEFFSSFHNFYNKAIIPNSCRRADVILTVSEFSKQDIVKYYGIDPQKVIVTYPGIADHCQVIDKDEARQRVAKNYKIVDPYILFVGNLQPRKNLPRLIEAYAKLRAEKRIKEKLVIVGMKAWLFEGIFEKLDQKSIREDVILTGFVPNEDLPHLYNAASVFVFPSIFEGFGSPVVESMACGTPTITSYGSSLEEVAGEGAMLIDPLSVEEIAHAIENVCNDPKLRADLTLRGLERSKRFHYRQTALETQAVFHQLMNGA